jgi:hypothetical protein
LVTSHRSFGAALAGAAALVLGFGSATAAAHHPAPGENPLSERELRSFESHLLGPEHAAEHARQRRETEDAAPVDARLIEQALETPGGAYEPPSLQATADEDPRALSGEWGAPFDLPLYAIHAAMLPTGKVLWMGPPDPGFGDADDTLNTTWAILWDPLTGVSKRVDPPLWLDPGDGQYKPANLYCAGQAFLASGELLVAGGTLGRGPDNEPFGLDKVYTFDPFGEKWVEQPEMEHGRWYPTNVQLPDGRQAIMSGSNELGASEDFYNETIEIFTPAAEVGGQGTLTTLVDANGDDAQRGTAGQPPTGGLYPHMFAMPSGKTLVAGPFQADSWYLHTPGPANLLEWSNVGNVHNRRRYATGVIAPPDPGDTSPPTKALLLGGYGATSDPATNQKSLPTTEYFDDAEPGAGWRPGASMQVARSNQNTVLLPDGSMVQVGGGVGADLYGTVPQHHNVELWDPVTKQWRLGAAQQEDRAYHSTAVLLPDGRVVSAGDDGNPGGTNPLDTAEVYSPPYLFKGPRPTISFAPETVELSDTFDVEAPDRDIARAALIAPGATTHANDMHQRYVPLAVEEEADGVQLTAPPNANAAPPGYYMLFLVDETGVPSVAKFVQVVPDRPDGEITIVNETALAGAPESFDFTGDLGSFSLGHGAAKTQSVPAGPHDVTEAPRAGWNLTSLHCDDGSLTELAQRRARIQVSPGEAVTCTFTNTRQPSPPPPGPQDPAPQDPAPQDPGPQDPGGSPGGSSENQGSEATEPPPTLTRARAAAFARARIASRLGDGSAQARRGVRLACAPGSGGFRCAFRSGAYRGLLLVRDAGSGKPAAGRLAFEGACGRLGRRGPTAIGTANVECPEALRLVGRFVQGRPLPRAYDCDGRRAPKRTTCAAPGKRLSFKYRGA